HERAPAYDRENRFFAEDFDELRAAGYLTMAVPRELGGGGLPFSEVMRETRRLAYWAPATALGTNMHTYWVGVASTLHGAGDSSCDWIREAGGQGDVFAAGHAWAATARPVLPSTTKTERVDGGWRFIGRKSLGSLSPVWTYLGIHGLDT